MKRIKTMSMNQIHEDPRFLAAFNVLASALDQNTAEELAIDIMHALEDLKS